MNFAFSTNSEINKRFDDDHQIPDKWEKIEKFQTLHVNDEKLIFMGGAITNLTWIPIPSINNDNINSSASSVPSQYLVISCKRDIYKFTKRNFDSQYEQTIIMIYKIENIDEFKTNTNNKPKLLYGIPFDTGPIYQIEFLPSGGYSKELNRLGLMAIANRKSDIFIYSLPIKALKNCDNKNLNVNINNDNDDLFINLKPVIILKLDLRKIQNVENLNLKFYKEAPCIKLCWSKVNIKRTFKGKNISNTKVFFFF